MTGRKKSGWRSRTLRELPADILEDSAASQQPPKGAHLCYGAAVVARCVIDKLRLLWRHLHDLVRRIIPVVDHGNRLVAAQEQRTAASGSPHHHRESRHHTFKPERLRRSVRRPSSMIEEQPSSPATPPVRHENCTVLKSKILWHCSDKHITGIECGANGCKVRLRTTHELDLHKHFCHTRLP